MINYTKLMAKTFVFPKSMEKLTSKNYLTYDDLLSSIEEQLERDPFTLDYPVMLKIGINNGVRVLAWKRPKLPDITGEFFRAEPEWFDCENVNQIEYERQVEFDLSKVFESILGESND